MADLRVVAYLWRQDAVLVWVSGPALPSRSAYPSEVIMSTASQINSAIASCGSGNVVKLNPGIYNVSGIQLTTSNVTLRGAGADQTILKGCAILKLGNGDRISHGATVTSGGAKGTSTITVSSTTNLSIGTMIELDRADDSNFVKSGIGGSRFIRQLNRISAISGNVLTLQNPLLWDF